MSSSLLAEPQVVWTPQPIQFVVWGESIGKARPKTVTLPNGQVSTYTPKKTRTWEGIVRDIAEQFAPPQLLDCPLRADVWFVRLKPKSARRTDHWPATKPDLDNLEKAVFDAIEKVLYTNDSRIVTKRTHKVFGDKPRVVVRLAPATMADLQEAQPPVIGAAGRSA